MKSKRQPRPLQILLTCEHASQAVPAAALTFFHTRKWILNSHRGYDFGALRVATYLSRQLRAPLLAGRVTRLVVDLNRSLDSLDLHSDYLKVAPQQLIDNLTKDHYEPFRSHFKNLVNKITHRQETVVHLSIHSFAPVLRGKKRDCHIGILFDSRRPLEKTIAGNLLKALRNDFPRLKIRANVPYSGREDGHTTQLRMGFSARSYVGIEIEFNQSWLKRQLASGTLSYKISLAAKCIRVSLLRTEESLKP